MKSAHRNISDDLFGFNKRPIAINSKQKGNTNERNAAKALESWVGVKFTRTPQSGALRRVNNEGVVSDIIPDTLDKNFEFPFIVETKHLKSISLQRILRSSSHIFKIWEQADRDATRAVKLPMALLRANGMPAKEYILLLAAEHCGSIMALNTPILFSGCNHQFSLIGFRLSEVIEHTPYDKFVKIIKSRRLFADSKIYHRP